MSDAPLVVPPDGLYTPEIKRHSLEKIRLHNRYARIFKFWKDTRATLSEQLGLL